MKLQSLILPLLALSHQHQVPGKWTIRLKYRGKLIFEDSVLGVLPADAKAPANSTTHS